MREQKNHLALFLKVFIISICFFGFWCITLLQSHALAKYLCLGAALFCIGLYGILSSKSILKTLIALEILFNSANLNLVVFSRFTDITFMRGQAFSLFVMAIAAAEAALGLALIIAFYRMKQTSSISQLNELKG